MVRKSEYGRCGRSQGERLFIGVTAFRTFVRLVAITACALAVWRAAELLATEPPAGFSADEWATWEQRRHAVVDRYRALTGIAAAHASQEYRRASESDEAKRRANDYLADVEIFLKGVDWAIEFDKKFDAKDVALLAKALGRANERLELLDQSRMSPPWTSKKGKLVRGYVSQIDGSTQPYGLVVPVGYDGSHERRLDVVLHGSTRPVGISELRFMDRWDVGDTLTTNERAPDVDYFELHPLGRVENGYRWAGETDVFEAIEAVCRQYRIDRDRIVLRGMSMGASGTWHLGLKNPDRFVALGPYCGYVDTHRFSETPLPNFVRVGPLPPVQEAMLHLLDSVDYAANAGITPAIACMGEKDVFFDAHVIMGKAMEREGLTMVNLISPGTGHMVDPKTHAEQMQRIDEYARAGLNRSPKSLRFVTWTLKYGRCHWLRLLKLQRHYERAEFSARLDDEGRLRIDEPRNVVQFAIDPPMLAGDQPRVVIAGRELTMPSRSETERNRSWRFIRVGDQWTVDVSPVDESAGDEARGKRPGLQGPIDDAFTSRFICVRGTGTPWNPTVAAAAEASLQRFAYEWRRYFRGQLPVVNDTEVDAAMMASANLILFGDPGSNRWIREALPKLPIRWDRETLQVAGQQYSAANHLPALIVPGPIAGSRHRYWVLNSGHSFHESELSSLNYLLYPRLGDWSVLKVGMPRTSAKSPSEAVVEEVVDFGLADEQWQPQRSR